jgi:hypothetical protein
MKSNIDTRYTCGENITFDEKNHRFYKGNERLLSVTRFIDRFHDTFDVDANAQRISERDGIPLESLLNQWELKRTIACDWGNYVHGMLELDFKHNIDNKKLWNDVTHDVYRVIDLPLEKLTVETEVRLYSKNLNIAGIADLVIHSKTHDRCILVDYKTNKELDNYHFNKKFYEPFDFLMDNNKSKYTFQLCLYKYMLQENGFNVEDFFIIHVNKSLNVSKFLLSLYEVSRIEEQLFFNFNIYSNVY